MVDDSSDGVDDDKTCGFAESVEIDIDVEAILTDKVAMFNKLVIDVNEGGITVSL